MKPQVASAAYKPRPDFEQLKPQGLQSGVSELSLSKRMDTEQHQQLVSERVELKAKGIGAKAVAGKPIGAKIAFKFLDPILALSAVVIAVIDLFGSTRAVGDDKADIGSQRTDFDLDHDPASLVPACGPMAKAIEESNRSFGADIFAFGLLSQRSVLFLNTELEAIPIA